MSQIIDWEQRPPTTITVQSIETVKSPYECDRKQENTCFPCSPLLRKYSSSLNDLNAFWSARENKWVHQNCEQNHFDDWLNVKWTESKKEKEWSHPFFIAHTMH